MVNPDAPIKIITAGTALYYLCQFYCLNFIYIGPYLFYRFLYFLLLAHRDLPKRGAKAGRSLFWFFIHIVITLFSVSQLEYPSARVDGNPLFDVITPILKIGVWGSIIGFVGLTIYLYFEVVLFDSDSNQAPLEPLRRLQIFFFVNTLAFPITLGFELWYISYILQIGNS